jgi:hypothetical protein
MRFVFVLLTACLTGCVTVGQVANLQEPACGTHFAEAMSSILVAQGEQPEVADRLATQSVQMISMANLGPRPFLLASPSGTDYEFFVQLKGQECLLRLYATQKGFTRHTNDITYIETRPLSGLCSCS